MLTAEGVTAVKSSTLDQVASLDRVAIQGIEIADICIVLTFARKFGLERPHELWPRNRARKWGRSSPRRCFALGQIQCRAMRNLCAPNNFPSPLGDAEGEE